MRMLWCERQEPNSETTQSTCVQPESFEVKASVAQKLKGEPNKSSKVTFKRNTHVDRKGTKENVSIHQERDPNSEKIRVDDLLQSILKPIKPSSVCSLTEIYDSTNVITAKGKQQSLRGSIN